MDPPNAGKSANASFSVRYNANNEELEEVFTACEDDPPTPQHDASPRARSENSSPKKLDKTASIIDKYFKTNRAEKAHQEESKSQSDPPKSKNEEKSTPPQKDVNSSPMKEYLNRLGKRGKDSELNVSRDGEGKDGPNETWKIFHDLKFKISQAVEEHMKTSRSADDKEKSVPRDSSVSDSEENSVVRDCDQQSVGDTDNQVSSIESSIQNLSELTQPVTAKVNVTEGCLPDKTRTVSESSDDTQKHLALDDVPNKDSFEEDSLVDVESGVEALEESNMEGSVATEERSSNECSSHSRTPTAPAPSPDYLKSPLLPNISDTSISHSQRKRKFFFTFPVTFFTVALFVSYTLLPGALMWNGFLMGLWALSFMRALWTWLEDFLCGSSDADNYNFFKRKRTETPVKMTYTIPSIKEHRPMKKFEGWINHYRFQDYDPYTYHISRTTTAFMKLEGCNLRISYTRKKIAKKAFWDEQIENVTFYQHRLYNLTGARVILMPKGLVQKRFWSKKYPICVILNAKERVQVLEKETGTEKREREASVEKNKTEGETSEAAASCDSVKQKKKFVWRRKDKGSGTDSTKGSVRQRFSRKLHKDKKTEDAATSTDPVAVNDEKSVIFEEEFIDSMLESTSKSKDENCVAEELNTEQYREYARIKEFLDEAEELEANAGSEGRDGGEASVEWSLHAKDSSEMHTQLYILARTGRDKFEWYRRIRTAIFEASGTAEARAEESAAELVRDDDMSAFKIADKEAFAYARTSSSAYKIAPDPVIVNWADENMRAMDMRAHERDFWPFMYKVIQAHQKDVQPTADVALPSSTPTSNKCKKAKVKKSTTQGKSATSEREVIVGTALAADVGWVNALLARVAYDAMRNPVIITRIQRRIQRKLNTLKLPSFMGRLVATKLSLGSSTPLVQVVAGPACDERGVWIDVDVQYEGNAYITLHTQINLMKLKEKKMTIEEELETLGEARVDNDMVVMQPAAAPEPPIHIRKAAIYDSELDDSAESSSDEDSSTPAPPTPLIDEKLAPTDIPTDGGSSTKKFLRMVDKITTSKYFQQISDYKYVKRAMEGLSNTDIRLQLELKGLEGRLAINLPPAPHDRVWLGFRSNPRLWLKARPALGTRAVRFSHINNWIEQKLCKEFEKVFVLPNMEDLTVELITPTPVDFE